MSEERDAHTAGAPVEETEATTTEVLAAVDRAVDRSAEAEAGPGTAEGAASNPESDAQGSGASGATTVLPETPLAAAVTPSAGPATPDERPVIVLPDELPSAGPVPAPAPAAPAVPEGKVLVSVDHPMAALYMQTPMPPDRRGNRGAGVLISLLATLGFAVVLAGALAVWLAPRFPPSTFLEQGLLPWILSWGFLAACVGYLVAQLLLVLLAGRAGWWAYVLGGFLVAAVVWAAAVLGYAADARLDGADVALDAPSLVGGFGLAFPVIAAAITGREMTIWFGAWIGARGRRVTRGNAEALVEYEAALAEFQAKQS